MKEKALLGKEVIGLKNHPEQAQGPEVKPRHLKITPFFFFFKRFGNNSSYSRMGDSSYRITITYVSIMYRIEKIVLFLFLTKNLPPA